MLFQLESTKVQDVEKQKEKKKKCKIRLLKEGPVWHILSLIVTYLVFGAWK